ncbi:MAG: efflux RND transporter periplasmic adaptor subunit [Phycisphaerae bacterium]|nr:efflux RND transporter periplasmic adaptor subunit [Phycisphaerae bacterium]
MKRFLMSACSVASVLVVHSAVSGQSGGGPPPALVHVDAARWERVEARREVTGEVRAVKQAALASEEAGLVISLEVDVGAWVEAGQVLARLDDHLRSLDVDRRKAQRRSAEATVSEHEARVEKANRDLKRLKELQASAGASQNEVDDAVTQLKSEEARLANAVAEAESAKAEQQSAERHLAGMTIRAPFAGSVVRKRIEVGEWVREGDAVIELVAIDSVDAYLDVPERFIGPLASPGASVQLRIPALDQTIEAPVTSVLALGDRLARSFPVRIRLENSAGSAVKGRLRPGMSIVGMVLTGEPTEALTIHKDAVMRNDAGAFVYFDAGGVAAVAPIDPQYAFGERVVVRSAVLKPGVGVITQGNERVFPGQPLSVMNAGSGAPDGASKATGEGG